MIATWKPSRLKYMYYEGFSFYFIQFDFGMFVACMQVDRERMDEPKKATTLKLKLTRYAFKITMGGIIFKSSSFKSARMSRGFHSTTSIITTISIVFQHYFY